MSRDEARERFNSLELTDRITMIGNELVNEINWVRREKITALAAHKKNMERLNHRIKTLEKHLEQLKDNHPC